MQAKRLPSLEATMSKSKPPATTGTTTPGIIRVLGHTTIHSPTCSFSEPPPNIADRPLNTPPPPSFFSDLDLLLSAAALSSLLSSPPPKLMFGHLPLFSSSVTDFSSVARLLLEPGFVFAASLTAFCLSNISFFFCSASRRSSASFAALSFAALTFSSCRFCASILRTLAISIAIRAFSLRATSSGVNLSSARTPSSVTMPDMRGPTKALISTDGRLSLPPLSPLSFLSVFSSSSSSPDLDRRILRKKPPDSDVSSSD
mmetsp:Transcript_26391/g.57870  ORF Transcript_26391/g.57870 Transcript_26391/m.57870 type:complete len:258 (+) Transcript_26391:405-1178(+)